MMENTGSGCAVLYIAMQPWPQEAGKLSSVLIHGGGISSEHTTHGVMDHVERSNRTELVKSSLVPHVPAL